MSLKKRLIVNADDLGADEARNAGIFEAIEAGVVTSVSILPNGPALKDAVSRIRSSKRAGISFGIHLNLSEGPPVSPGLKILTSRNGCFLGKEPAQRLLLGPGGPELQDEIRSEFQAQMDVLRNAGIPIDHLDGHQHVHIFPSVIRIAMEGMKANRIRWIRIPDELPTEAVKSALPAKEACEALLFSRNAERVRPLVIASGLVAAEHFRGLFFKGRLPASRWPEFLEEIPQGITELMVHPGRAPETASGPFSGFSNYDRERELQALTDAPFRLALSKSGVELTSFPECI
jgi:chitin disaccharide deacetylase